MISNLLNQNRVQYTAIDAQDRLEGDLRKKGVSKIPFPEDQYPELTPQLKKKFANLVSALHGELTPWDALLFTIYTIRTSCSLYLNPKESEAAERKFAQMTLGIYNENFLATMYEEVYGQEVTKCSHSFTKNQIDELQRIMSAQIERLQKFKKSDLVKNTVTMLKNSLCLFKITQIFIEYLPNDFIMGGWLSHFQTTPVKGKFRTLLQFCHFSADSIENAKQSIIYPTVKKPSLAISLLISFLESYVKEESIPPLDEQQKSQLLKFYIQQIREERLVEEFINEQNDSKELPKDPPISFVGIHLLKRCRDWFDVLVKGHHTVTYKIQHYSMIALFASYFERWKEDGINPFATHSLSFTQEELATIPGHELMTRCRTFATHLDHFILEKGLEKFACFLNRSTQIDYWANAIDELRPMIEEGEELYDSLPDLFLHAKHEILKWVLTKKESERSRLLKEYSKVILDEIYPILPYLVSFKELLHFIDLAAPYGIKNNNLSSEIVSSDLYEYILHEVDSNILEAFHLISEESLVAELSSEDEIQTIETVEIQYKQCELTAIQEEKKSSPENVISAENRPSSQQEEKKVERVIHSMQKEMIQKNTEKKQGNAQKKRAEIPLSIKREKLVKWILKEYGETCRIKGGHLIFTTKTDKTVVVPAHGKTVAPGTLHAILKQLGQDTELQK